MRIEVVEPDQSKIALGEDLRQHIGLGQADAALTKPKGKEKEKRGKKKRT